MRALSIVLGIVLLCVGLGNAASLPQKPSGHRLTGPELIELVQAGLLLDGVSWRGNQFTALFVETEAGKGKMLALLTDRHTVSYWTGETTWRIQGDTLCVVQMTGREECTRHYRLEDGSYQSWFEHDGTFQWTYRQRPRP